MINSGKTESGGTELMKFIGRTEELKRLEQEFEHKSQRVCLIYGRRRVGKSELIKQGVKTHNKNNQLQNKELTKTIYYECKQTTEANNTESLSALVSEILDLPPMNFASIEGLLNFLFEQAISKKIILVLDEYPYLLKAVAGLDSILQSLVDKYRDESHIKLVICGSYIDVMKSLLEHANPLYGRVDLTILLRPMDYYDSAKFYPQFSNADKVCLYSVFGGIPYYNKLINSEISVRENIINLISGTDSRLENEVSMYISSEISKITNANEVFLALAKGYSKYRDVLDQSHVSSGPAMVDVIEKLIDMELIQKTSPINDPNNKRKSRYQIIDSLSLFYFRYIFKNLSQRSFLSKETFFDRYIAKDFEENYVPYWFEEICKQYLIRQNRAGNIDEPFDEIGRYWYDDPVKRTNGEFDIVTHDPKGYVFYEAKFRKSVVGKKMIEEEIAQVKATGLNCYKYGFFSRSGFSISKLEDVKLIDLDQLYK